jgi:hypothetical protein
MQWAAFHNQMNWFLAALGTYDRLLHQVADVKDRVDAVLYLAKAKQVTGETLHVDGGAHAGRW